eukprot:scaffold1857_cov96-Skeletonema_dohrnii-CCMP3373.AAC.5
MSWKDYFEIGISYAATTALPKACWGCLWRYTRSLEAKAKLIRTQQETLRVSVLGQYPLPLSKLRISQCCRLELCRQSGIRGVTILFRLEPVRDDALLTGCAPDTNAMPKSKKKYFENIRSVKWQYIPLRVRI